MRKGVGFHPFVISTQAGIQKTLADKQRPRRRTYADGYCTEAVVVTSYSGEES